MVIVDTNVLEALIFHMIDQSVNTKYSPKSPDTFCCTLLVYTQHSSPPPHSPAIYISGQVLTVMEKAPAQQHQISHRRHNIAQGGWGCV